MKAVGSVKHEHIVDAAIKRFSHFGISKTTLTEIADDTGISKTSLFYYFQDKGNLLEAVGKKIVDESLIEFKTALSPTKSVEEGLLTFIDVKRKFYKKYLLLAVQSDSAEMNKVAPHLCRVIEEAQEKITSFISDLLKSGIDQSALKKLDVEKISHLLMETFEAFELSMKSRKALLEIKDIDDLFDKQKEVVKMLLNGVKSSVWKN